MQLLFRKGKVAILWVQSIYFLEGVVLYFKSVASLLKLSTKIEEVRKSDGYMSFDLIELALSENESTH